MQSADDQRERFYFFLNPESDAKDLVVHAVGDNFTSSITPKSIDELRSFVQRAQA